MDLTALAALRVVASSFIAFVVLLCRVGVGSSCAAAIDFVTAVVATAIAVAPAVVAADIVATISVCTIVATAQGIVHHCPDSGWQSVAVDAANCHRRV